MNVLVLHETLLYLFLCMAVRQCYGNRRGDLELGLYRGLLGIRRMHRVPNARIRELCGVRKDLNKRIDEGVFRWFDPVERMERDRNAKSVYLRVCG